VRTSLGMKSLLNGPADNEVLRIYVDDDPIARVDVPLAAALDGSAGEIFAPPFGAGSAHRMAWYYPVAFSQKLIIALDNLGASDNYTYQCDVVPDDMLTTLSTGPRERLAERDAALNQMSDRFHPAGDVRLLHDPNQITLEPDASQTLTVNGPATIQEVRVRVREADLATLKNVSVSVSWDGSQEPALELPLAELLASADVAPTQSSLALTSFADLGDRVVSLKLPMPFLWQASWSFTNTGQAPVSFELRLLGEHQLPGIPFGYLHVQQNETLGPTRGGQHEALHAFGRGRLVGVCAYVEGYADTLGGNQPDVRDLLEGDVRALLDGLLALDGIGTEQYADDAFHFVDAPYANTFAQAWGVVNDAPTASGKANFCRWHVLGNELDFHASMDLSLQLGGAGNPNVVTRMRTVAFYYLLMP
jgi:hypothetical protein